MLKFFINKGRVFIRIREQVDGKRLSIDYFPNLSSDGFDQTSQRFEMHMKDENDTLLKIEKNARDVISEFGYKNMTGETFRKLMLLKEQKSQNSFFSFADSWFEEMKVKKGYAWSKQINTCINLLKDFSPDITFNGVDRIYHKRLLLYLEKKNYSTNTIGSVIKNLKRIMTAATETGLNTNMTYISFKRMAEDVENIYLTEEEIERLYKLELTPELIKEKLNVKDVKKKISALDQARKLFIIGCWTGLRVGNYKNIEPSQIDGDYLTVIAIKGGSKLKIPLHRMIKEIIADGWPAPMFEQKINVQIKDLGLLADINTPVMYYKTLGGKRMEYNEPKYQLICTHTARRSFASNMLIRGVPTKYIMAITGHKTERDFNRYTASVDRDILTAKIAEFGVWK